MKIAGMIYKWILIGVVLQLILVGFLNIRFSDKKIIIDSKPTIVATPIPVKDIFVDLPQKVKDPKLSFDSDYFCYTINDKLEVYNRKDKKVVKTIDFGKDKLSLFKWLPDRNVLIYAYRAPDEDTGRIQVSAYNTETDVLVEYPRISGSNIPKKSEVIDLELSQATKVVYVYIKSPNSQNKIYRYNIMNELSFIKNVNEKSIIKQANLKDVLFIQDENDKISYRDGLTGTTSQLALKGRLALLGVSQEDKVYLAELGNDNKVEKILVNSFPFEPGKNWTENVLKVPVNISNIFFTADGYIVEQAEDDKWIRKLDSNNKLEFKGTFSQIMDRYIVSIENDKLRLTSIDQLK